jgi:DNA-binding GntR family transcriptional regulator
MSKYYLDRSTDGFEGVMFGVKHEVRSMKRSRSQGQSAARGSLAAKNPALLSEHAYQRIREEILFFRLRPGARASESFLTQQYDLRQAAVRSALPRLIQEGLIIRTDERAAFVAPLTLKDVREIYEMRLLLEPRAAELAAANGLSATQIQLLRRVSQARYDLSNDAEVVQFLRANRDFNLTMTAASGNSRLTATIAHLQDLTLRILYVGSRSVNFSDWFQRTHDEVIDVITAGNGERARELWTADLKYAERVISDAIVKLPEVSHINLGDLYLDRASGTTRLPA